MRSDQSVLFFLPSWTTPVMQVLTLVLVNGTEDYTSAQMLRWFIVFPPLCPHPQQSWLHPVARPWIEPEFVEKGDDYKIEG